MSYTLRPATPEDASVAAHLIFISGAPLFRYLFYKDADRCEAFISKMFRLENNVFTYRNATLAVNDKDEVAGLIYCVGCEEQADNEIGTREHFLKHFGLCGILRRIPRLLRFVQFSGTLDSGEFFINHVAVQEAFRRQGVAYQLLNWAEQEAQRRGLTHLGLYVDFDNYPARHTYETFGFTYVQRIKANIKMYGTTFHGQDRMRKDIGT